LKHYEEHGNYRRDGNDVKKYELVELFIAAAGVPVIQIWNSPVTAPRVLCKCPVNESMGNQKLVNWIK
jgi:hypothetical protein